MCIDVNMQRLLLCTKVSGNRCSMNLKRKGRMIKTVEQSIKRATHMPVGSPTLSLANDHSSKIISKNPPWTCLSTFRTSFKIAKKRFR